MRFRRFQMGCASWGLDRVSGTHIVAILRLGLVVIPSVHPLFQMNQQAILRHIGSLLARVTDQFQLGITLGSVPQSVLVQQLKRVI